VQFTWPSLSADLWAYQPHFDGKGFNGGDYGCEGSS